MQTEVVENSTVERLGRAAVKFIMDLFRDDEKAAAIAMFEEVVQRLRAGEEVEGEAIEGAMKVDVVREEVVAGVKAQLLEGYVRKPYRLTPPAMPYGGERKFAVKLN